MSANHPFFHFSVKVRTPDSAVLHCLRALNQRAQLGAGYPLSIGWGGTGKRKRSFVLPAGLPFSGYLSQQPILYSSFALCYRPLMQFDVTMFQIGSLCVAMLSLGWAVSWSIWSYRRLHKPHLAVVPRAAILFGGPGMKFKPAGSKKSIPIKPTEIQQWCVGIKVFNFGPSAVTIDSIQAHSIKHPSRWWKGIWKRPTAVGLQSCWIAVQEDGQLPRVLKPGDIWHGLCDQVWLGAKLQEPLPWHLRVDVFDNQGRRHKGAGVITDRDYAFIAKQHDEREEE